MRGVRVHRSGRRLESPKKGLGEKDVDAENVPEKNQRAGLYHDITKNEKNTKWRNMRG